MTSAGDRAARLDSPVLPIPPIDVVRGCPLAPGMPCEVDG
jgi:hypothetical protein